MFLIIYFEKLKIIIVTLVYVFYKNLSTYLVAEPKIVFGRGD